MFASTNYSRWFLLFFWLGLVLRGQAQDTAPGNFRFEHLTVDQGLAHSDAMAVAQDRAGFIWVGTNRGLDRYDGYQLRQYMLPVGGSGVSANRIRALHLTPDGRLWVGTQRGGLAFYDAASDRLRPLSEQPAALASAAARRLSGATVAALASDAAGRLWVGTANNGLFALTFGPQGQVQQVQEVPWLGKARPVRSYITSLVTDAEGMVWVGTTDDGLCVVRPDGPLAAEHTALREPVRALHLDWRGDLWVGTEQRVLWVSATDRRQVRALASHPQAQQYPQLQSLLLDSTGRLWVGTIYGLYVWEAGATTGQAPPLRPAPTLLLPTDGEPSGLSSERIHQLFEDRGHVLWVCASAGGLNKVDLRQKPFELLRRQLGARTTLPNNYINAIYKEEATNTLWLGTRNGVAAYDLTRHTYHNYLSQPMTEVSRGVDVASICQTRDGALWFGTRNRGLVRLRRRPGGEQLTTFDALPGGGRLTANSIEGLAEDRFGTLWAATFSLGLLHFDREGRLLGRYSLANRQLPSSSISFLLFDARRDVLWASTSDQGLLKLRVAGDSVQLLKQFKYQPDKAETGLRVDYVWPLLLDRQGTLWIGTIGGGLHRLSTDAQGHETLESYHRYVPESDVESMLADEAGNLWLGGTGLYRFTPRTRQYLHYDVADGLQSNSFKVGAAARGADGTLYFGGINGVSYFQPAAIRPNPYAPVTQLVSLRIANQPVTPGEKLNDHLVLTKPLTENQVVTIRPSENDFSVEFVGLNYANPQKTSYAYQLRGYNTNWMMPLPGQRTASFANLPPGRYTLRLKTGNGEGVWSAPIAPLTFEVLAPWYKTMPAYLAYAGLLLGLVALYRRFEMSQQQLRNRLVLEQFQTEKEKELTNLKLGFFTNISHELRTPLTLILGPMEEIIGSAAPVANLRDKVQLMYRQTNKLLELVNQLLDFRKVETGNVPLHASQQDVIPLLTDQYASFQLRAQERGVAYLLDLPAEATLLHFDQGKLEIILTNLLANALKYVRDQGRVELAATLIGCAENDAEYRHGQLVGNYLKITVSDTGVGISPYEIDRIFDPYYQASHTNTLRMTGTGIGLALAQQFARRHGGELSVSSTQGVGTTFELRMPFGSKHLRPEELVETEVAAALAPAAEALPAWPEPATPAPVEAPGPAEAPAPAGPPRLLVVEDNEEVRDYLCQLFETDYEVLAAEDGVAGWDKALAQLPDLIISDVMMPRSDGLELCQRLKQHPKTAHIPVLLLTARTAETHELEGLGIGADDYVSKPFNPKLLQAKAETMLRNRRKLHEFYQRQILLQPTEIVVADADREFLERAMGVVEKHLGDSSFNVQVLLHEMAMSQSVLYRRIKSITGQTAVEFIRDVRLKRAAQLLTQSQLRISEVAFEVGIENAKYFRQVFQKLFGVSPSEYAKQHRTTAVAETEED